MCQPAHRSHIPIATYEAVCAVLCGSPSPLPRCFARPDLWTRQQIALCCIAAQVLVHATTRELIAGIIDAAQLFSTATNFFRGSTARAQLRRCNVWRCHSRKKPKVCWAVRKIRATPALKRPAQSAGTRSKIDTNRESATHRDIVEVEALETPTGRCNFGSAGSGLVSGYIALTRTYMFEI